MLKKALFFALFGAPLAARAALPPSIGNHCDIDSNGIMTCSVDGGTGSGDLVNAGTLNLNSASTGSGGNALNSVDLSVWAGTSTPGGIFNTGALTINAPGQITVGGSIANNAGYASITGSYVSVGNSSLTGAAVSNLSGSFGDDGWALQLNAGANDLNIIGSVWNNTADGTTAAASSGSMRLHAAGALRITGGGFVSFGGDKQELSAGGDIAIDGGVAFDGGAAAGANVITSGGAMRIGGALTIANGATATMHSGQTITVNGVLTNSSGTTVMTAAGGINTAAITNSANLNITGAGLNAAGAITNSGGIMAINAGGSLVASKLDITGGLVRLTGGTGLVLTGAGGLGAAALQMGGAGTITAGLFLSPAAYAVQSAGAVAITGALDVEAGALTIAGAGANAAVSAGSVTNRGTLNITGNIDSVAITGAVDNFGTLDLATAGTTITTGALHSGGTISMNAKTGLATGTITATGAGTAAFRAGTTITTGAVDNRLTSAAGMSFIAAGDISTGGAIVKNDTNGNLSFVSSGGNIATGDVDNWGNIRFDSAGDLTILNLTNNKSFWAETAGAASFATLANAAGATEFHLKAATTDISAAQLASFLLNTIPNMYLELTAQTLTSTGDIANAAGNLDARATGIDAVNAENGTGRMTLAATGALTLAGAAINGTGTMSLSGSSVAITGDLINSGTVSISSANAFNVGNITNNSGALAIGAGSAAIGNIANSGGSTSVNVAAPVIAALSATGGAVNLNGAGTIAVANNVQTAGGVINISGASGLDAAELSIAGGSISTNGGGRLNIDSAVPFVIDVGAGQISSAGVLMTGTGKTLTLNAGTLNLNNGAIDVYAGNSLFLNVPGVIAAGSLASYGRLETGAMAAGLTSAGNVIIGNGGIDTEMAAGLYITNPIFVLKTTAGGITDNGGINVGAGKGLTIASVGTLFVGGAAANAGSLSLVSADAMSLNRITNDGAMIIDGVNIAAAGRITNSATMDIINRSGAINTGGFVNSGTATITNDGRTININGTLDAQAGTLTAAAGTLSAFYMKNAAGAKIVFDGANLKLVAPDSLTDSSVLTNLATDSAAADGLILAAASTNMTVADLTVSGATRVEAGKTLNLTINNSANLGVLTNAGAMSITANDVVNVGSLTAVAANSRLALGGAGLTSAGDISVGNIWRNYSIAGNNAVVAISSAAYEIKSAAGKITAKDVQLAGLGNSLTLTAGRVVAENLRAVGGNAASLTKTAAINVNTQNLQISGLVSASKGGFVNISSDWATTCPYDTGCAADSMFAQNGAGYTGTNVDWNDVISGAIQPLLLADIAGSVSGGVRFYGLGAMNIGGNYHFNDDSVLHLAALPEWVSGDFSFAGTITDANGAVGMNFDADARPMVSVGGILSLDLIGRGDPNGKQTGNDLALHGGNIGLTIFDSVDSGKIIWLVQANEIEIAPDTYLPRNINVYFCNADGTRCFDYISALRYDEVSADRDPIYIRWDSAPGAAGGPKDSLYAVFDPTYGGPIMIYGMRDKARPLRPDANASAALGALDDLVYFGLPKAGFSWNSNNPIEAVPAAFKGTVYDGIARAIYGRMDAFSSQTGNARPFVDLARLVMPTEAAALGAMVSATERMTAAGLSRRMQDEALWTRNRVKTKAWADVDAGMQTIVNPDSGGDAMSGFRFAASGGYDIQFNEDLIAGFTAGLSISDGKDKTAVDIGLGQTETRNAVAKDTDFHIGGYVLSRIADQLRVFVHAAAHSHKLAVSGDRGITGNITGDGETASIVGEMGLVHSISAQYVVGTLSARYVQNNGFDITEKIGGADYMRFARAKSTTLTPGYAVLLQKRVYLKPTFIMRPFMSVGAEYDLMQSKEDAVIQYRFAASDAFADMAVESDPLWLRATAGVEFLTIGGLQFGATAEYLHNAAIQTIGARATASVRF